MLILLFCRPTRVFFFFFFFFLFACPNRFLEDCNAQGLIKKLSTVVNHENVLQKVGNSITHHVSNILQVWSFSNNGLFDECNKHESLSMTQVYSVTLHNNQCFGLCLTIMILIISIIITFMVIRIRWICTFIPQSVMTALKLLMP